MSLTTIKAVQIVILLLFCNPAASAMDVNQGDLIQDAVDIIDPGDTIYVHSGTYTENVVVDKPITITSVGSATVQTNNSSMNVFLVTADRVNISGFCITGAGEKSGIRVNNSSNCIISDNIILYNYVNIQCVRSNNTTLTNNTMVGGDYGIHTAFSSNNTITDNNITESEQYGICIIDQSDNNIITDNTASNGNYTGIALAFSSDNNTIGNNTVNANRGYCGVLMAYGCEHNMIKDNTIVENGDAAGILLYELNRNNIITRNHVSDNELYGIRMYNMSDGNLIYDNYFRNNDNVMDDCDNVWNLTATAGQNIMWGMAIGGNYWSNYIGNDSDCDGFGDMQYNISYWIPPTNIDYLPLIMQMCGDVDWNCFISANDVVETYNKAVDPAYQISMWAADVDGNDYVSANDVIEIYQKAVDPTHVLNCNVYEGKTYEDKYKHGSTGTDCIDPCINARISE